MDGNIDPAIDPAMESQANIFTKYSLENDLSNHNNTEEDAQGAAHAALLAHQQSNYNFADLASSEHQLAGHELEQDPAEAAANLSSIINFNQMENDDNASATPHPPEAPIEVSHTAPAKHQSHLKFLQNALTLSTPEEETTHDEPQPKQVLIKDPSSKVSIVVVNPGQADGSGRLGRPRRPLDKNPDNTAKVLAESANNNKEESVMSTFRLDSRPIMGPGSRGGGKPKATQAGARAGVSKTADTISGASASKEGDESVGTVSESETTEQGAAAIDDDEVILISSPPQPSRTSTPPSTAEPNSRRKVIVPASQQTIFSADPSKPLPPKLTSSNTTSTKHKTDAEYRAENNKFIVESYESLQNKGRSVSRDKQDAFAKLGLVPLMPKKGPASSSHTTSHRPATASNTASPQPGEKERAPRKRKPPITKARELKRKDIPGPITPALWDAYDPELLKLSEKTEETTDLERIALGYSVKPAPYAPDIMTIMAFIAKFKKFFSGLPNLGPQDFEEGLHLEKAVPAYDLTNVNQETAQPTDEDTSSVSENMDLLLRVFLKLLLNRKKDIPKTGLTKALGDLKSQVLNYGLPAEWRDDSGVYADPEVDDSLKDPEGTEPLDISHPEMFETVQYHYDTTKPQLDTPLDNPDFETEGLRCMKPKDRLILFRCMVHWSAAYSEAIRQEINVQVNRQDASGDKETYYVSRFVKDGQKGVEEANNSLKLHPRKKLKKDEDDTQTFDAYTDATVNPLDHHMSFRLLDFYAGDMGVNGRFFLCRSADNTSAGFASVPELVRLMESDPTMGELLNSVQPSRFKLYVQDVTTMLKSVLQVELSLEHRTPTLDPWYEVAGTVDELTKFTSFLDEKLESNSNKHTNLLTYLVSMQMPLSKFEKVYSEYTSQILTRESRKRAPVVDLKAQDRKLRKAIKRDEKPEDEFLRDSDEEMLDEDEDYDLEAIDEPDDDDDDDYRG